MREIVCPICNGRHGRILYGAKLPAVFDETAPPSPYSAHYQINRCERCGLTYSSPVMDDRGVSKLYEESSETNVTPGEEDNVRRTMALYYQLAAPYLRGRERMLDIGCDMGFMLEAAKADGFKELHGIEPVPAARRIAQAIEGAIITDKFFEQTEYPSNHFDLITLVHVLDHLYDPRIVLQRALKNLATRRPGRGCGSQRPIAARPHPRGTFPRLQPLPPLLLQQGYAGGTVPQPGLRGGEGGGHPQLLFARLLRAAAAGGAGCAAASGLPWPASFGWPKFRSRFRSGISASSHAARRLSDEGWPPWRRARLPTPS